MLIPSWSAQFPELLIGQSTRQDGVSAYPTAALNLGLYTDDDIAAVTENRRRFAARLGIRPEQLAGGHQVHGKEVKVVTEAGEYEGYDGFVTNVPGIILAVTVADCTPVLLYDPVTGACGAAHGGWRGTVAKVSREVLKKMIEVYGVDPANCLVFIAACISARYFEVSENVARQFPDHLVKARDIPGKYLVDLKTANAEQLIELGVLPQHIEITDKCTVVDNAEFFSYRKEGGKTGRMLGIVGRR